MSIKMYLLLSSTPLPSSKTAWPRQSLGAGCPLRCSVGKGLWASGVSFGFEFLYMCLCLTHWRSPPVFYLLNYLKYLLF